MKTDKWKSVKSDKNINIIENLKIKKCRKWYIPQV